MKEIFYEAESGNIYQIIHGWFKRKDKQFYFFSWMNQSTKGKSSIIPKNIKIKNMNCADIRDWIGYELSNTQAQDILDFIIKEYKVH